MNEKEIKKIENFLTSFNLFLALQELATDPCDPFPCGSGADCFVFGDSHFCACKNGLKGDPNKECNT
jgi:FPC/CPF motif-containing protein YcgG